METSNPFNIEPPPPPKKNLFQKMAGLIRKTAGLPGKVFAGKKRGKKEGTAPSGEASLSPFKAEKPRAAKPWGLILLTVVLIVAVVFAAKFFLGKKPIVPLAQMISETATPEKPAIPVNAFKVGRFNYEAPLNVLGTLKGAVETKLAFEVPGVISSINYREGERYEEGALLVSLKQDDILIRLKRAQAELNKSETQVRIASDKVEEHEKLFKLGAIPRQTLEKVKLEMESAKYEAEAVRLEVKAHESMLEKSNLYAPSAGMIGDLKVEEGETVTPNSLLGTSVNIEYVYAEFGVVERDANKIALGQKARIFVDAYPDKTFEGVVETISPVYGGKSRTSTTRIRIENPDRFLMPGMFSRIRILLYSKKNALVIPTDAMQGSEGDQWVFVIHTDKATVEKRAVTVGYTRPDYTQIDAGISEGELVAVSNLERLEDGAKVRVLETQEAEV